MISKINLQNVANLNLLRKSVSFKNSYQQESTNVDISEQRDKVIIDYFENRKLMDKQSRIVGGLFLLASMLTLPFLLLLSKKNGSVKVQKGIEKNWQRFISLKNDKNVPTLYECNSIDSKLKQLLQNQVDYSKATPEDMKRAGMPKSFNRLILYGAPGSGKSYFAKIFAKTLDADYKEIKYSDLNSRWVGEHLENISRCFDDIIIEANEKPNKKFVVTFNEIDSLVLPVERLTSSNSGHSAFKVEERSVFINYLDEVAEKAPNVTIIGTTNVTPKNNGLDGAALSRFMNIIEVSYPNHGCMTEALKKLLGELENGEVFINSNKIELEDFAKSLCDRKASFRNLNNIVNYSKNYYLKEAIKDKNAKFKMEYLIKSRDSLDLMDGEIAGVA